MDAAAEHAPTAAMLSLTAEMGEIGGLTTRILASMSAHSPDQVSTLEAVFALLNTQPEAVAVHLSLSSSAPSTDDDRRVVAVARILCGLVVPDWGFAPQWTRLSDEVKTEVYNGFMSVLKPDPSKVIIKLATVLGAWPHVLPLFLGAGYGTYAERKMVLLLLGRIPPIDSLANSLSAIRELLSAQLITDTSTDLRIDAMGATANVIKCLRTKVDKLQLIDLFPLMEKPLEDCLDLRLETSAQEALQLLAELACAAPSSLRRHMSSIEPWFTKIATAAYLPVGTRRLAAYFLTDCAKAAGVVIKVELALQKASEMTDFVSRVALLLMEMLLEVKDDVALPIVQSEDEISQVAQHCLHRLAKAIGGRTVMPVAMQWLHSHETTNANDWKKCYATLVCIAELAEGCANVMVNHLDAVVPLVTIGFEHTRPIVHWVTIDAIVSLYSNIGLQMPHHNDVLMLAVRSIDVSFHDPHVKEHAAQAVLHIIQNGESDMLEPVIGQLLNCLDIIKKAEEAPLLVATLSSSPAVAAGQTLLPAAHETVPGHLPQGIGQTIAEPEATPTTGSNKQQAGEPLSKEAYIDFLKAFSNGGVTSTTSLTIIAGYQLSIENFVDPWKIILKSLLFGGIGFSLLTAGAAHAAERHHQWLGAASTMVLFEGLYTVIIGGGLVGLAHTSGKITAVACALAMGALTILWSWVFPYPKWPKKLNEWSHHPYPQEARAGLFKNIGEVWQTIKGQTDRAPEPRGGWFSKFRQITRRQPAGPPIGQSV